MKISVNPTNLLFEGLSDRQAQELRTYIQDLILKGEVTMTTDPYFDAWCKAAGIDGFHPPMVYSSTYPQRALLSLLLRKEAKANQRKFHQAGLLATCEHLTMVGTGAADARPQEDQAAHAWLKSRLWAWRPERRGCSVEYDNAVKATLTATITFLDAKEET